MKTTTFICQLQQSTQEKIKKDIINFLISEGYDKEKQQEIVNNAMDGRLTDLEDNINIEKYL